MSRADSLAGLTGAIAGHALGPSRRYCACGLRTVTTNAHAAHVAAVALAWLEGHGWAEGEPEYAVSGAIMHPVLSYDHGAATTLHTKHGMPIVRRYVTPWAPVETGDAP